MLHQQDDGSDAQPDYLDIPPFLRTENRTPAPVRPRQEYQVMRTDEETGTAAAEAPATAPATKAAKPRKAAAKPANGHGNGKAPAKAAKAAKAAAPKAGKAKATKAAPKAERHRDPAKLDAFGFRKDSIKSRAAALYAKGKGATLAEVKEAVGSVQFNLLTELTGKGFTIDQTEVKNEQGRMVTRYKLHAKAA